MPVVNVNSKAVLSDILQGLPSGQCKDYLIEDSPNDRLGELVYYAHQKQQDGYKAYIEVKFASKYSSREKRLEVVTIKDSMLCVYKISSLNRFDKDALELNRIVAEISEGNKIGYSVTGSLIMKRKDDIERATELLKQMNIHINVE